MKHDEADVDTVLAREIEEATEFNRSRAARRTPSPRHTVRGLSRGGSRPALAPRVNRPIPAREIRKGDVLLRYDRFGYIDRHVVWNVTWAGGCGDTDGCPHIDVRTEWGPTIRLSQHDVVRVEMPRPDPCPADDPFGVPNTLLTADELRGLF